MAMSASVPLLFLQPCFPPFTKSKRNTIIKDAERFIKETQIMRRLRATIIYSFLAAAVILSACYALGLFGGENISFVQQKGYAEQSFTFTGTLVDGKFDGQCEIVYWDGSVYVGSVRNGRFQDEGSFMSADGWRFDGRFEDGLTVDGVFSYESGENISLAHDGDTDVLTTDGWRYSGAFGELGQHGFGTFIFEDGAVYSGEFAHGLADGEGEYFDASGRLVYKGSFSNGLFNMSE